MKVLDYHEAMVLPDGQVKDWAYNATDCVVTYDVHDVLQTMLTPEQERTYAFERAMQAPAFAMTENGILVDDITRAEESKAVKKELAKLVRDLGKEPLITEVWDQTEKETGLCLTSTRKDHRHMWQKWEKGKSERTRVCTSCGAARLKIKPFAVTSAAQRKHLLYDLWGLPPQTGKTGEVTADKEGMARSINAAKRKKSTEAYVPLIERMMEAANLRKQLDILDARLSRSGRFMTGFRVGNAWTGRWSSTKNHYGEGGNAQNIAGRHRHVFISDPGYLLDYADLKQGESKIVAYLAGDEKYIEAHEIGDTHTYATRLIWPQGVGHLGADPTPWTWDIDKDKALAKALPQWDPAPDHDFRFQSKRIQHGSNYGLTPTGISYIAHIPQVEASNAQRAYFQGFPRIRGWQHAIQELVAEGEVLTNPLGRSIRLFGRPWEKHTFRQGLAFIPQSTVADIINVAIWRVWEELDPKTAMLLAQVHDAMLLQFLRNHPEIGQRVLELMMVPIPITDYSGVTRECTVFTEAAVGANWGHFNDNPKKGALNPYGIKEI